MNRPHIALFEPSAYGHQPYYLRLLLKHARKTALPCRITLIASPLFASVHPEVIDLANAEGRTPIGCVVFGQEEERAIDAAGSAKHHSFAALLKSAHEPEQRAACLYALGLRQAADIGADHICFMYVDAVVTPLAARLPAPMSLSGFAFRSTFFFPSRPEDAGAEAQSRFMTSRLLGHPQLRGVFAVDPFLAQSVPVERRTRLVAVHDPVCLDPGPDIQDRARRLRQRHGIDDRRKVLLMFGEVLPRKGVPELLDAVCRLDPAVARRTCLLLVGQQSETDRLVLTNAVDRAHASGPVQVVVEPDYVADVEVPAYFALSDAVLVPYRNHHGPSGVLLHAAAARRPVLGPVAGTLGALIRRHGAGLSIDLDDPDVFVSALARLVTDSASSLFDEKKAWEWVQSHDDRLFAPLVLERLIGFANEP